MSQTVASGTGIKSQPPQPLEKSPHELEMERKAALLAKVRSMREGALFNKGALLKGNPAKEYCWVNSKDDRRAYFEAMGWVICKDSAVVTRWKQDDGTHRRADLILYEIDREMYEAIQALNELRGLEAVEGSETMFLSTLDRERVPAYKPQQR